MPNDQPDFSASALLIVGHGSTVNADSSAPSLAQAQAIRERGRFREMACCFWKEEPSLRDALLFFNDPEIREVFVVPNFISEGYFTQTVIPRELELDGSLTTRANGQVWKYCEPVGNHPGVTDLLLQRAAEVAPGVPEAETTLFIVGHGTALNDQSAVAAKRQVEQIAARGRFGSVQSAYMEEPPLISDWAQPNELAKCRGRSVFYLGWTPFLRRYSRSFSGSRQHSFTGNPHRSARAQSLLRECDRDRAGVCRNHRGAGGEFRTRTP